VLFLNPESGDGAAAFSTGTELNRHFKNVKFYVEKYWTNVNFCCFPFGCYLRLLEHERTSCVISYYQ
jgi:hypothetical protein